MTILASDADLEGANLIEADLTNADLRGANLSGVIGLTCEQLTAAKNWQESYRGDKYLCGGVIPAGPYTQKKALQ